MLHAEGDGNKPKIKVAKNEATTRPLSFRPKAAGRSGEISFRGDTFHGHVTEVQVMTALEAFVGRMGVDRAGIAFVARSLHFAALRSR